jgi:GNAT superfamily N-acetyltransferase
VEARLVDPSDDRSLVEWHAVFDAVERETWPDRTGYSLRDVRALAAHTGTSRRFRHLAATDTGGGPMLGVGVMELSLLDNRHAAEVTIAVHPAHRRRGVGSAIVDAMVRQASLDGRTVLNSLVDVPVAVAAEHPSTPFARHVGFVATLPGNSRYLRLPLGEAKAEALRGVVASARDASAYRMVTFTAPWPDEFIGDQCELARRMSTDEPAGDGNHEEEVWDVRRIREGDALLAARGVWKLAAVAQHIASGRLVAFSELLLSPDDAPTEAWQLATLVHPEHRGHRLGLAVKLANLDALAVSAPAVRRIMTGNASVNGPMIAVNDLMGFEIAGSGQFWQKQVAPH